MTDSAVPAVRLRVLNEAPLRAEGKYVLYWMTAFRRLHANFGLDRAVELARELKKPLVILEALRVKYRWASDRIHRFVIDGMADHAERAEALAERGVVYYPYVEPQPDAGSGLLESLADDACAVIGDDFPCFFLPRMLAAVAPRLKVRFEVVDSNGLYPLRATDRVFTMAFHFRRFLQKELRPFLEEDQFPQADPLKSLHLPPLKLPRETLKKWPLADCAALRADGGLADLPIDHDVTIAPIAGGPHAAAKTLRKFLAQNVARYGEGRNNPDDDCASGLSPYLHFGHISTHEIFRTATAEHPWSPEKVATKVTGKAEGWWGLPKSLESFLDELITWREIGYNFCAHRDDYDEYDSLPEWCRKTFEKHATDKRPQLYSLKELERAETYDPLWNAAQRQLTRDGKIHNYLRMLWGKKVIEWSETPQQALKTLVQLNNKYALDGRNPNSYSGIFWCFGRYDRPWSERSIFGQIRYMSSDNTAKKLDVKKYLRKYGE